MHQIVLWEIVIKIKLSRKVLAYGKERQGFTVLFIGLNFVSGYSTVVGATHLIPSFPIALGAGILAQSALLALLSGFMLKKASMRKWLAALFFASLCVYSSSFTYWTAFAEASATDVAASRASLAHSNFERSYVQPIRKGLSDAEQARDETKLKMSCEAESGCTTNDGPGEGEGFQKLQQQLAEEEAVVSRYTNALNSMQNRKQEFLEDREISDLESDDFLALDMYLYSFVPEEFSGDVKAPVRDRYVDERLDHPILSPVYMILSGKVSALASMGFAILFDGVILLSLGTAIVEGNSRASGARSLAKLLTSPVTLWKGFSLEAKELISRPVVIQPTREEYQELENALDAVRMTKIPVYQFLNGLLDMTNDDGTISLERFDKARIDQDRISLKMANNYRMLYQGFLHTMSTQRVGWIANIDRRESWMILEQYRNKYDMWISDVRTQSYAEEHARLRSKRMGGSSHTEMFIPPSIENPSPAPIGLGRSSNDFVDVEANEVDKSTDGNSSSFRA